MFITFGRRPRPVGRTAALEAGQSRGRAGGVSRSGNLRASALTVAAAFLAGGCALSTAERPLVTDYKPLPAAPAAGGPAQLTARFLGTSTIVLSDGRTTIMTDGFFSRPSVPRLLWRPVTPNLGRITAALEAAKVTRAAAIFVAQSHHDHAMDTPYVAQLTEAKIVGSLSTENIALGSGFPRSRIARIGDASVCRFGAFTVRIYKTPHSSPMPIPGEIREPLHRSAVVEEYKEGGNFTFHVSHPWGDVLIVPSRGVREKWVGPPPAQFVFLGIGGLVLGADQLRPFWKQYVTDTGASSVYPIHWDRFTRKVDAGRLPGAGRLSRKRKYLEQLAPDPRMIKQVPYADEILLPKAGKAPAELPAQDIRVEGCEPELADRAARP